MPKSKRQLSPKLKFKIVLEVLSGEKTPAQVARAYGVHPNSVALWKKTLLERGPEVFGSKKSSDGERQVAELEQLIGKKEVEIALLKNFLGRSD